MSSVSRKASSWFFDSEKWTNEGKNEPHSAVYAVHVKEELQKGMNQHRGVACCIMLKVGGDQMVYFVTSSDLETDKKQADLLPCSARKTEGRQLVVNSTVKFGPFAFLSFDRHSSPGLKGNPLTCLDFQVPKQNLKSEFEARTFVGTKKLLKLKFEYQGVTGKYIFSAKKKDGLEQSFVLGAPIIIKNKDVTDKRSSSRWPVVGVMGLDEDREFFPYFVTADIFERKPVHSKGGRLGPGIELNATAAEQVDSASGSEGRGASTGGSAGFTLYPVILRVFLVGVLLFPYSRPVQKEEEQSVPKNELHTTAADSSKSAGGGSPVFQTTQNYPTQTKHVDEDSGVNFPRDIEYYQKSLHIAREAGDRAAEGNAYYHLGIMNFIAKDIPEAFNCFEKSLCLAREAGDRAGETTAHFCLGIVHFDCKDLEKAVKCFEESSNIAREAGDQAGVRRASHYIAESYLGLGNSVKDLFSATLIDREEDCADSSKSAGGGSPVFQTTQNYPTQTKHVDEDSGVNFPRDIEYYQKSLHIAREAGDRAAERNAYYHLGTMNFMAKDIPEAFNCFEKSLCLAREAGDRAGETTAHFCLGMVHFNCNDFEKAVECFEESSNIAREAGDQAGVRRASHYIAESYLGLGNSIKDFQKAIDWYEKGLNIAKKAGDQAAEANASFNLGAAYYSLGNIPKAINYCKESLLIAIEAGNRATEGKAYCNLGLMYNSQSNFSKAIECYEKSGNVAREAGDWVTEGKAYYHLGNVYESQSNLPKAVECYKKSLKIAREAGDQATVGKAYFSLGTVYQSQSNHLKAAEYYEKSLHIARESGDQYTEWKSYLGRMSTSNSATGSDERGTNLQLARTSHSTDSKPVQTTSGDVEKLVSGIQLDTNGGVQPQSQTKKEGSRVELRCEATGDELSYSWLKDEQEIEGQRGCCLVFEQVSMADFGSYVCQVEKKDHSCSSEVAELDVTPGDGKSYTYLSNLPLDVEEMVGKELSLELGGKKA
ncbi:uncharacterized protein [Acropora muricata]|uniref:uncharacterized protein isoform X3 n=1 Tax=Acropora muricata TaxID=159855 RepID=UPI0034E55347